MGTIVLRTVVLVRLNKTLVINRMVGNLTSSASDSTSPPRKGLTKRVRKKLTKRLRKKLTRMDPNKIATFSEFEVLRYSILNGYFSDTSLRSKKVSTEQLRAFLVDKVNHSSLKFNIPKKYRNRTIDALLGQIPFKNLLLWCDSTSEFKTAALHLCMAVGSCENEDPKEPIIHHIGGPCMESNCSGTYVVWLFNDPNKN